MNGRGKGRGNIFESNRVLNKMLRLRSNGVGPSELARMFGVDHSTIIYHAKRHGVMVSINKGIGISEQGMIISKQKVPRVVVSGTQISIRIDDDGSPINPGKNYAEYLEEMKERRWNQLINKDKK